MTIEQALVRLLLADPTVAGLVNVSVYPQQSPQSQDPPFVLYATSDPEQTMNLAGGFVNLYQSSFRFDCYGSDTYTSAKRLSAAVRAVLFGFLTLTPGGRIGVAGDGVRVQGIIDDGGEDNLEPPVHGEEHGVDWVGVRVRVWFNLL